MEFGASKRQPPIVMNGITTPPIELMSITWAPEDEDAIPRAPAHRAMIRRPMAYITQLIQSEVNIIQHQLGMARAKKLAG